jgi:hypothetical protein
MPVFPEPLNMRLVIIKQHEAELLREAERARLARSLRSQRVDDRPTRTLNSVRSALTRVPVAVRRTLAGVAAGRSETCADCDPS